jgi:16S rRNA (guanine966-N2)-methyltransferase
MFNILAHRFAPCLDNARVLDLFAGTGALGLEALSRGADHVLFVETAAAARGIIRQNIEVCDQTGTTRVFRRDATSMGDRGTTEPYTLFFCDPPYGKGLAEQCLANLTAGNWLADGALGVIEEQRDIEVQLPPGFELLDVRALAGSEIRFVSWHGDPN